MPAVALTSDLLGEVPYSADGYGGTEGAQSRVMTTTVTFTRERRAQASERLLARGIPHVTMKLTPGQQRALRDAERSSTAGTRRSA